MGRTQSQHAGQSVRLRTVAALLFAMLFGLQLAPLAQAQMATPMDCCMAAEGKGCSMHLHRAAQAQQSGHTLAALHPPCPCVPMAPASATAHGAVSLSALHLHFALTAERALCVQLRSLRSAYATDRGATRGPPELTFAA